MPDFRPVVQLIGWHVIVLGAFMVFPSAIDLADGDGNAGAFILAAFLTVTSGLAMVVATRQSEVRGLKQRQAFLLTVIVWAVLPAFGALPFMLGAPGVDFTDAFFESMSGMTTTGSTVFSGLDTAPRGMLLWRAMLQWFGGLGIVIVAIIFLPAMRIGGMQFFRAVSFDVSGESIPRASQIAVELLIVYLLLTLFCAIGYAATGMSVFDAISHSMTTVSTGGYANYDSSFAAFGPASQYVAILFMALAAMPFLRFIELMRWEVRPLWRDSQVRGYLAIIAAATVVLTLVRLDAGAPFEATLRSALFTVTSILTTTGYATTDYGGWGGVTAVIVFTLSLTGGCSASTTGAAKVFRYQILFNALVIQIRRLHNPHGVFPLRYQGRPVEPEVVSSTMAFFFVYIVSLMGSAMALSVLGLDFTTSVSAPAATLTAVGPGLGPVIGPSGNFASLPAEAKWVLSLGMLMGRLEFLSVLVLFVPAFWRR